MSLCPHKWLAIRRRVISGWEAFPRKLETPKSRNSFPSRFRYLSCQINLCSLLSRYGKVDGVKILPQRYPNQGVAAFIDFYDVRSAVEAKEAKIVYGGCELRTNFKTKSTERFDKYDHPRRDQEYGKEPPYMVKHASSPTPPPEREKEKQKDKIKSRGKERYILERVAWLE